MRYSMYLLPTSIISHILMHRAGMLKKLAAGIYDYLPLALLCLEKFIFNFNKYPPKTK